MRKQAPAGTSTPAQVYASPPSLGEELHRARALETFEGRAGKIGGRKCGSALEDMQLRKAFQFPTTYLTQVVDRWSPAPTLETRRHFVSRWKSLKIDRNFTVNEASGSRTSG